MNIKMIKEIVNSEETPDEVKEYLLIDCISNDEKVIPAIIKILDAERKRKKELLIDMNAELSRAHIYIDERPESVREGGNSFNKNFVVDEIAKFYIKWRGHVSHCFNRFI